MLKQLSLFALIANPLVFHVESLAFQRRCHTRRMTSLKQQSPSHQDYYDAEEAAAWDAHDLSDPGMEAAMMEAYVQLLLVHLYDLILFYSIYFICTGL
jgi:hypothetical protein